MRKIMSFISTIVFLWLLFVCVEYFRSYRNDEKLILTLDTEVTEKYTKRTGLGFSIIEYNVSKNDLKDGTIIDEFYLLGFCVSKTMAIE